MDTKTLYAKLSTVPPAIKGWLGSDGVINAIDSIPHRFNLPEDASMTISKLIQKIQIKDVEAEYFAGELSAELKLDKNKAVLIAEDIKKNIFTPIKDDLKKYGIELSHFDEFNIPAIKNDTSPNVSKSAAPASQSPKMVFDMALKPLMAATPKPATIPSSAVTATTSQKPISAVLSSIPSSTSGAPAQTKIPSASEGKFASPSLTQAGWSRATALPTQPPASSSEPAPIILHEDAKFTASEKTADFHLARPGGSAEVSLEGVKSQQVTKPAVLELGSLANAPAKPEPNAPKFTHYTQFQISTQPIDRHVTEVTAVPKVAAVNPTPVAIPAAPPKVTPAPAPTVKPIVTPFSMPPQTSQSMPVPRPPLPPQQKPQPLAQTPVAPPQKPVTPVTQQPQAKVIKVNYP